MSQNFKIEATTIPTTGVTLLHCEWETHPTYKSTRRGIRDEVHSELQVLVQKFVFVKWSVVLFSPTANTLLQYNSGLDNK